MLLPQSSLIEDRLRYGSKEIEGRAARQAIAEGQSRIFKLLENRTYPGCWRSGRFDEFVGGDDFCSRLRLSCSLGG